MLPSGACDCHTHVVGDRVAYPMVAERHYTPGPAPHAALLEHLERNGLERVVLVQPSFYGTDNRCLLDSLERLQGRGRGIAVVDAQCTATELADLHARGVRGLRVNVESAGIRAPDALQDSLLRWADRIGPLGWHLQVYAAPATIAALAPFLARLPVPVVLDHFAMLPAATPVGDPVAQALLQLLRSGNAWVKLSAPYRITAGDDAAVAAWAGAFLAAAPQRVLWGSDWPHTDREPGKAAHEISRYREIPPAALAASLQRWLPGESVREQVLARNPAALYGF
ncbi:MULTISPECIES: amidohydrolase family protein [Ramlibacter]|uniref:amidohydrolase family protein n=1 Tax=Ramlibacter TaxID=174951 RepID=UPI001E4CC117|nr:MULTISPECIES: amidohydrolase family protein [Ramlibacter]